MRNLLTGFLLNRNPKFNLAIIALFGAAFVLACGGSSSSTPKNPIPAAYLGDWTGQDGTKMSIRADNTGDYKQGSTNINGAAVEVDEAAKEIKFTMLGVDVGKYKIDTPPQNNQMKLAGVTFRRAGGFDTSTGDEKPTTSKTDNKTGSTNPNIPSEAELDTLVGQTMEDFNSAVQSGDFDSFHEGISKMWQKQITPEKFVQTFDQFIKENRDVAPKAGATPTYSPEPSIDSNGMLVINGNYLSSQNKNTIFELKYLKENGNWKLFGINVRQSS